MDSTQQRVISRRETAEKQLQSASRELAAAQAKVDKINIEIGVLNDLLGDDAQLPASRPTPRNGHPVHGHDVPAGVGGQTAQAMARELGKSGGKLTLAQLADRLIESGFAPESDRNRVQNNVSSVFYRAIKNPRHPLFRRAGRGEIQSASVED